MKLNAILSGLIAGLLFGLATPVSKSLLSSLNSFQVAGLLYLGAALAFAPHFFKKGLKQKALLRKPGTLKKLSGIILCGGILGPLFLMLGLKNAQASSVSIWLNLELVATALLGVLFFREHLGRLGSAGLMLTIAAGLTVTLKEPYSG